MGSVPQMSQLETTQLDLFSSGITYMLCVELFLRSVPVLPSMTKVYLRCETLLCYPSLV